MSHRPTRGSDVEAFIKRERGRYELAAGCGYPSAYSALNDLLDDYRLHADTGTWLDEEVVECGDNLDGVYVDGQGRGIWINPDQGMGGPIEE